MRIFFIIIGRLSYWLGWPVLRILLHNSRRARGIVVCQKKVMVVKAWLGNGKWNLPGGGINSGESAKTAFVRELKEETGIDVNHIKVQKVGNFSYHTNKLFFEYKTFLVKLSKCPRVQMQVSEIYQAEWVNISDLTSTNSNCDVIDALSVYKNLIQ